jgi:Domain of unknown function (DUF4149)
MSPNASRAVRGSTSVVILLALGVWLGGLLALGAVAAPLVFAIVPFPSSADAMSAVFRRFDLVAMACAVIVLAGEAGRALAAIPSFRVDYVRALMALVAGALATVEGTQLSPRIAALHEAGAMRGVGAAGAELSRLHDFAESCGKTQVALLVGVVALEVVALLRAAPSARRS